MNKIKYSSDSMKFMTLFESMTGTKVKDCIVNSRIIFIIEENEMGRAIGKNGVNIKRMENKLKKKIKLVEYSNNILQFVKNVISPIEALDIKDQDGNITIYGKDVQTKAMLIGRERQTINHLGSIVKRYFDVKSIRVV